MMSHSEAGIFEVGGFYWSSVEGLDNASTSPHHTFIGLLWNLENK
jgi:hypothetical protein